MAKETAEQKYLEPGTKLAPPPAKYPTTQEAIDQLMGTYMNELTNLGPEYNNEMEFLKPYLMPTQETMSQLVSTSKANESPTGDTGVMKADEALGQQAQNLQPGPGFNALAGAGQSYEQSLPYANLLQTLLMAGKNQVLGYSTIPNLSAVNTKQWPGELQQAYTSAVQGLGYNPSTNLPTPQTAGIQAQQQAQLNAAANPASSTG